MLPTTISDSLRLSCHTSTLVARFRETALVGYGCKVLLAHNPGAILKIETDQHGLLHSKIVVSGSVDAHALWYELVFHNFDELWALIPSYISSLHDQGARLSAQTPGVSSV